MNAKITLLIVDDIAETRKNICNFLQYDVDIEVIGMARSGREGIQLNSELAADVVLMDINMPDIDGITATEEIRKRNPFTQVIILSVQGDQNYMRRAMLAGARDYIVKPPIGDALVSAIRRAGEMAHIEKSKKSSTDHKNQEARELNRFYKMEAKQLELSTLDCVSRLQLYQSDPLKGRLADQFEGLLTGIAHDLKSPISIATSVIEILAQEDKQRIKPLARIWRQLNFIKWIVDSYLGICLSEKADQSHLSLSKLVSSTLTVISERAPKNTKIDVGDLPKIEIKSDERILKLVLTNLLMNSIESIGEKLGNIKISGLEQNGEITLSVSDSGEDIPRRGISNLFNLGSTTKDGHLGNGLYISRRLLYQIYGKLNFKIDPLSNLKIFEIIIPISHNEIEASSHQNMELQIGLDNLYTHLSLLRDKELSQNEQELLQTEFNRQTSVFTNRLTQELLSTEKMILEIISALPNEEVEFIDSLRSVENNCLYCRLLTRNILEISGGTSLTLSSVSLIEVINEVLSLVSRKLPKDIYEVVTQFDLLVDDIEADPLQLMQVFMNLTKNAIDAMPHGGKLDIYIGQTHTDVFARFHDSGIGISPENLQKLFTKGFSTKSNGYGIGLYSSKNIVEKHHGTIDVQSQQGRGTVFTVTLPKRQTSRG